jgi:hypothetical protein
MRRLGLSSLVLLLVSANGALGADRTSVTKELHASSGPWVVTLSINLEYPYGSWQAPPALFSAADGFAFLAGDVLTIQYDSGLWCAGTYVSVGTCVDANGYRIYGPADDHPLGTSTLYAPSKYMNPATYPIYLMQLVGTFADARGQIVGTPFKVGNGPTDVTVPSGATQLQLGSNLYGYIDARDYYTVLKATVSGPAPPVMKNAGSMAQLASAGYWKTTIALFNPGPSAAQVRLNFFDNGGNPLLLPLSFPQSPSANPLLASTLDRTLNAGATLFLESTGPDTQESTVGWAQLLTDGSVTGFAIFRQNVDREQEAVVPLETRNAGSYVLLFDNTNPFIMGVAVANNSTNAASIPVIVRDEAGNQTHTQTLDLAGLGHISGALSSIIGDTTDREGSVEFSTPPGGQISVLGLRFNGSSFTTVPVIAK